MMGKRQTRKTAQGRNRTENNAARRAAVQQIFVFIFIKMQAVHNQNAAINPHSEQQRQRNHIGKIERIIQQNICRARQQSSQHQRCNHQRGMFETAINDQK